MSLERQGEQGRVVLVTGGSRGLGKAIVERLVNEGWLVAFTYRGQAELAAAVAQASAGRAFAYQLDLAQSEGVRELVEEVEKAVGPIEALVNNAGIASAQLAGLTSDALWNDVFQVNLAGPFRLTRVVMRGMLVRRRGVIVNVASLAAIRGVAGQAAYASSKAGLLSLTRSLARELGGRGIRVNAVVPGLVATDMTAPMTPAAKSALRATECLPTGVEPLDVAAAVSFLLSEDARAITGQQLVIDAGASV